MSAPERIFARIDTATVYMDGSSPLIARTREFRGGAAYVRADIADAMLEALKALLAHDPRHRTYSADIEGLADAAISKAEGRT